MEGNKRLCRRPAGYRVHHGRFNLDKTFSLQIRSDKVDDPGADSEGSARKIVGHEVEVTLAITRLHVRQTVKFFRQRTQRLCQQVKFINKDTQFTGPGFKQCTFRSKDIPDIPMFEFVIDFLG